jgi:transcriptional antiterminator NusG
MAWYAIHVKTSRENAVCEAIRKQAVLAGYAAEYKLLVPKRKLPEKREGVYVEVLRIMFPGYVLVESEEIQEFAKIVTKAKGIFRFLQSEGEFQKIRLEEISAIVYMTDETDVIGASKVIAEGGYIEVVSGPLKGYEGKIKRIDKHRRRAKVEFLFDGDKHLIDLGITRACARTEMQRII